MATPSYGASTFGAGTPNFNLNVINASFIKVFSNAMYQTQSEATFVQKASSTGKYINLAGVLQVNRVKPWVGKKVSKQLSFVVDPIPMKPLQATVSLDKYDLMGDAVGLFAPAIANLAAQGTLWTDWAVANALQSGYSTSYSGLGWQGSDDDWGLTGNIWGDNLSLFNSAHTWVGTNVSAQTNLVTGSLADPLTYGNAVQLMENFVGNEGQPLRVRPVGLIYCPKDEYSVLNALTAQLNAVDARPTINSQNQMPRVALSNILNKFGLQLHKLSTLYNDPGVAYLIGEVNGVSAIYQYMLEQFHLVPSVAPTDPSVFYRHEFEWSCEGFGRLVVPSWFLIVRISDPNIAAFV